MANDCALSERLDFVKMDPTARQGYSPATGGSSAALQCLSIDTTLSEAGRLKLVRGLARLRGHRTQASDPS